MGEGVIALDLDLRVGWLNAAAEALLGSERHKIVGRLFHEVVRHADASGTAILPERSVIARALAGEVTTADEDFFYTLGGARHCVTITGAPILDPDGAPEGVVLAFRDCSERQRSQAQLRAERERYKSLFDLAPDAIVSVDVSGVIVDTNFATERMTGRPASQAIGRSFAEFLHPDDAEQALMLFESVIRGQREEAKLRVLHADGHYIEADVTALPVAIDGEVVAVHGIVRPRE